MNYLADFYKLKKKTNVKKSHEFLLTFSEYLCFLHSIIISIRKEDLSISVLSVARKTKRRKEIGWYL